MAPTIRYDGSVVAPQLVMDIATESESGNVVHKLLGNPIPDITLRPASSRTGTWKLFFLDEASSEAAELLHRQPGVFVLDYPERPSIAMTYVVEGRVRRTLDPDTLTRWVLEVGYREVSPVLIAETDPYPDTIYPDDAFPA